MRPDTMQTYIAVLVSEHAYIDVEFMVLHVLRDSINAQDGGLKSVTSQQCRSSRSVM